MKMSDKRFDDIVSRITETYPKACVLWVEEIINDSLLANFLSKEEELTALYGNACERLELFHGTKEHCIDSIASEGLKCEYNRASALGKGTYFSTKAMVSSHYMGTSSEINYMFLCDVLVGQKGQYGQYGASQKKPCRGQVTVDSVKYTTVYVVPEDDSIYPRYIIAFHKNPPQ